jgi:hypothetical protein
MSVVPKCGTGNNGFGVFASSRIGIGRNEMRKNVLVNPFGND